MNVDEAFYRNLDPATGRWWQIDPKIEDDQESLSPYNSMFDNPVRYDDPKGDCPLCKDIWDAVVNVGAQVVAATAGAANAWSSDQLLGAGHVDNINGSGASYGTQVAYIVGNKIGTAAAIVTGVVEDAAAATGELASFGIATPLAIPVAVHRTSVIVTACLVLKRWLKNGNWITTIIGHMNQWEMFHPLNLLIRFPRITKNLKTLITSGPKKRGAYMQLQQTGWDLQVRLRHYKVNLAGLTVRRNG